MVAFESIEMRPLASVCVLLVAASLGACVAQPAASPTVTATATTTPGASSEPTTTPPVAAGVPGAIEGKISYPSDFIPPLRIYAIEVAAPGRYRVVSTEQTQQIYRLAGLPPGDYRVFALSYTQGSTSAFGAGYTKAVPCGLGTACTDHTPLVVQVKAATVSDKIDMTDWYAPPGTFPAVPTGREPFAAGDNVIVSNPYADEVNARSAGTTRGAVVGTFPNGTPLTIVSGPTSSDGYDWYVVPRGAGNAYVAGFALRKR